MQPLGCFGSSLANDPASQACMSCARFDECSDKVLARRPAVLRLLSKFTDGTGEYMAFYWLTPDERKKVKKARKQKELEEMETRVYGDRAVVMGLKASLDKRIHPMVDRMTRARINLKRDGIEALGGFSAPMGVVISKLRERSRTMKELTEILATECNLTRATAQRDAYALTSILNVSDRTQRVGPMLELK